MHKELTQVSIQLFQQLKGLILQLSDDQYPESLELLSGNSLSKHVRHVLEIFDELLTGIPNQKVNYDARQRNLLIEQNRTYAIQFIEELIGRVQHIHQDDWLDLEVCFNTQQQCSLVKTTISRELAYQIEHATHHMAIIQIAVKHTFAHISVEPTFGVAFSTQTYLNHVHA